jgi:hypothetical protein
MDCPRCKLISPDTALRCDCGYDFESKTVRKPYFKQDLPKEIRTFLIFLVGWNALVAFALLVKIGPTALFPTMVWTPVLYWCYTNLVRKRNWARIALIFLTFPIGLALLGSEARLYCLQTEA